VLKFAIGDRVSQALQFRNNPPAKVVDRQNRSAVPCEMNTDGLPCGPSAEGPTAAGRRWNWRRVASPIEMWRTHYNTVRPHSSLGYRATGADELDLRSIARLDARSSLFSDYAGFNFTLEANSRKRDRR